MLRNLLKLINEFTFNTLLGLVLIVVAVLIVAALFIWPWLIIFIAAPLIGGGVRDILKNDDVEFEGYEYP